MNIMSGWYFPWPIKAVTIVIIILAIGIMTTSPILFSVLFIMGLIIFTTHYGVHINISKNIYKEYTWFLAWKKGKELTFTNIEYLYIKANKVSRTYNSRGHRTTISGIEYDAFLKFSENEKIFLTSSKNRLLVINRLISLKKYLNTRIRDYTEVVPDEI